MFEILYKKQNVFMTFIAPCRLTSWMNLNSGGDADKEILAGFISKYSAYTCLDPTQIR